MVQSARLEAEIFLARAAGVTRAHLFAHPEKVTSPDIAEAYRALLAQRAAGEPVAYITGEREFWSLSLRVSPAVLIPRPETELLVEAALARTPPTSSFRIADLGTGSGAIALAIASERPTCTVHATDLSAEALAVARDNASRLDLENVRFHQGSWLEPLRGRFEIVVSNPPYVADGDPHLEAGDLRFEPNLALVAGADGMEAICAIAGAAPERLAPGGWLLFEHGAEQAGATRNLLTTHGFESIETLQDLAGSERVTLGRLPR